jgi:cyclophilin family peptidyl-prolyl cis-trans isomerase
MIKIRPILLWVLLSIFTLASQASQTVTLETSLGSIQIELLSDVAPKTVENFLNYVNRGDFDGTFFHRSVPGFILQGGGFSFNGVSGQVESVASDPPVINEFSVSNTRGTLAMAKLGGNPNSATNQWYINLADNSSNLDNQNGGFTVFGRVIGDGMDVVDAIAVLPTRNFGGAFTDTPTINFTGTITADIFVNLDRVALDIEEPAQVTFAIDRSSNAPITGLWWGGIDESGWGMSLTQQSDIMFATIFTYDDSGFPKWFVVSNCAVQADGCSGEVFRITRGTSVLDEWQDLDTDDINAVGNVSINFLDNNQATMTLDIDGVSATRQIVRQEFSTLSHGAAMTGLWYNALESGWGVSLTRQSGIAFATMYTYDANGLPIWYVASNCTVTSNGCTGELFEVTGGSPLTQDWKANVSVDSVGTLTFAFTDDDNGSIEIEINGTTSTKVITRQVFAIDSDSDGISDGKDNCPETANADQEDADSDGTGDVCES